MRRLICALIGHRWLRPFADGRLYITMCVRCRKPLAGGWQWLDCNGAWPQEGD